jgi:hypothetical protein|tara:strand:+ start:4247 stop:4417 length:171 start_codon:yes stop_codon:yes gene_type:complete
LPRIHHENLKFKRELEKEIKPYEASINDPYNIKSATYLTDKEVSITDGSEWLTKIK